MGPGQKAWCEWLLTSRGEGRRDGGLLWTLSCNMFDGQERGIKQGVCQRIYSGDKVISDHDGNDDIETVRR